MDKASDLLAALVFTRVFGKTGAAVLLLAGARVSKAISWWMKQ